MRSPQAIVILAISLFKSVYSLAFEPSHPTAALSNDDVMLNGWSPKPTTPPALPHGLLIRQAYDYNTVNTCGFIDSDFSNALYCGTGYGCAFWTTTPASLPQYFDCCPVTGGSTIDFSNTNCYYATTCLDYGVSGNSVSTGDLSSDSAGKAVHCGRDSQYCAPTYLSSRGVAFTHFGCVTTTNQFSLAYDTYSGGGSTTPTPTGPTSFSSSSSSVSATSTSPAPTNGGGGSNTGAIAGGAVGGVVGLALIGALIGWLVYRKRKQRNEAVPEVSQYTTYASK